MPLQIWHEYLQFVSKGVTISKINMRNKQDGWENYKIHIVLSNGREIFDHHSSNLYMQTFLSDKYLNKSCYNCIFKNNYSVSDLIIGDFWGVKNFVKIPENILKYGVSFVSTLTAKGENLINNINDIVKIPIHNSEQMFKFNGGLQNKIVTKPQKWEGFNG